MSDRENQVSTGFRLCFAMTWEGLHNPILCEDCWRTLAMLLLLLLLLLLLKVSKCICVRERLGECVWGWRRN